MFHHREHDLGVVGGRLHQASEVNAAIMADVGGLPEIPLARPAREDCTHRTADPLRRLDRRGAGADRSRIAALASPPPSL
jgi:hypothetical protein